MKIVREKLYQGKYIDLRSYEVEKALQRKERITAYYKGEKMTISPVDLKKKKLLLNKTPIDSKVNQGQKYYLYSYLWKPDKKVDINSEEYLKEMAQLGVFG